MNNEIYVGSTGDLKRRIFEHNNGSQKSTRRYKPWVLFYYKSYRSEKLARVREKRLKYNGNALRELKKRIGIVDKSGAGFTLLEILLSISVLAIIAGVGIPVYQSFQVRNELSLATNTVAQTMRRAQTLAEAVEGDDTWGVYVGGSAITLFKGANYLGRDVAYDEIFNLSNTIVPTGDQEIIFNKFTGEPQSFGTLILTTADDSKTITINAKGLNSY